MFNNFLLLLSFFFILPAFPQNLSRLYENYITDYYLNKKVPSISAGVINNGKVLWTSSKGFSDLENSVPATKKTLYRIASISKPMTAVAIMQLVESGKINLDDDARKYITYIPQKQKPFTIRQLLNHTSGIRSYRENEFDSKAYFSSTKDVVLYIMKDSLISLPGTKYIYTTLGYNLLAAVIENVSGLSYSDYMKRNIFEPAEMNSTIPDFQRSLIQNRARGYIKDAFRNIQNAPLADLSIKYAGGGLLSTAEDILKFSLSLMSGKLLKPQTLDSMLVPTRLKDGSYRNYGLGFTFGTDETGRKFYTHSGGGTGFTSNLLVYPEDKAAAVYLINIADRNLENPAKTLISITFGKNGSAVKRSLPDRLMDEYLISAIDSITVLCSRLVADSSDVYNTAPEEQNLFGYDLISINRLTDAIVFFKYLIFINPNYARAFVGLADAYYADGNRGLALKNYRNAVKLDSSNNYASSMIKKINGNR